MAWTRRGRGKLHHHGGNTIMTTSDALLHLLLHHLRLCWNCLRSLFHASSGNGSDGGIVLSTLFGRRRTSLAFDNGMRVEIGNQIAEGGFSYVFEAFPVDSNNAAAVGHANTAGRLVLTQSSSSTLNSVDTHSHRHHHHGAKKYALKRINCSDREIVRACRHEAGVHRSLPSDHPNLLELLGLKFDRRDDEEATVNSQSSHSSSPRDNRHGEYNVCYMLFPYVHHSLRGEIGERNILGDIDDNNRRRRRRRPFATNEVLQFFGGLVDALMAMHDCNLSHRDVKLENVLLQRNSFGDTGGSSGAHTPILMDFGSAGPLTSPPLSARHQISTIVEEAASNTTLPYRPPELFEGGMRHGPREVLDYGRVDVWSLGCVLFGLMHGTSPFEMEFSRSDDDPSDAGDRQHGLIRIVECTRLKILGEVPFPPWATAGGGSSKMGSGAITDGRNGKYPLSMYRFVRFMVNHDRTTRPTIHDVAGRFGELHSELAGRRWTPYDEGRCAAAGAKGDYDDFDSLIASRDFV